MYVNRYAGHQTSVNRHLLSTLNALTAQVYDQQQVIAKLETEIEVLRGKAK
jgi:hypothetical protein